jgi:hypothetical protein
MPDGGADRARTIAMALGGCTGPGPNGDYLCLCPAHPDTTPSLSLKDGDSGLLAHCFAGCSNPAIFAAMARLGYWTPPAADPEMEPKGAAPDVDVDVEGAVEGDEAEDPAEAATKAAVEAKAKKLAEARARFVAVWAGFDPKSALHPTVDAYCDWRGVSRFTTVPTWLRFMPSGLHVGKDKNGQRFEQYFPMLVVAGEDPKTGELLGAQREYLAYGGKGAAPLPSKDRKKTVPGVSLKGAIARMAEPIDDEFLLVGEGWVTVKTVMDATGLPGWSVFGAPGIASFDPLDNVKQILFLADRVLVLESLTDGIPLSTIDHFLAKQALAERRMRRLACASRRIAAPRPRRRRLAHERRSIVFCRS